MALPLLTDSTMPVNFCRAGIGCARAMADHLGHRLHMVSDVHEELWRQTRSFPALESLLEVWPRTPVRELDLELKADVARVLKARRSPGEHPSEDRGEVATVFYAERRRNDGEGFEVVTDDGFGKRLARDRGLAVLTTPKLVAQMASQEAISMKDGERVWRHCFSNRDLWKEFAAAVDREREQA